MPKNLTDGLMHSCCRPRVAIIKRILQVEFRVRSSGLRVRVWGIDPRFEVLKFRVKSFGFEV